MTTEKFDYKDNRPMPEDMKKMSHEELEEYLHSEDDELSTYAFDELDSRRSCWDD